MKWTTYEEMKQQRTKEVLFGPDWPEPKSVGDQYAEEMAKATKELTKSIENKLWMTSTCTTTAMAIPGFGSGWTTTNAATSVTPTFSFGAGSQKLATR